MHAELLSFPLQILDDSILILLFVVVLARIDILFTVFDHMVDDASQFVRRGRDGYRGTMSSSHAPVESAQGALAVADALGGQAKGLRSPVLRLQRATFEYFATGDVVMRRFTTGHIF